jgi:putative glycosyltransferase (TIGR04372 family)
MPEIIHNRTSQIAHSRESILSLVNLKSKLPPRFQKYASFGVFPKIILAPVAFLILTTFLLAKPVVQIRLYRMVDSRIGHLAMNTERVRLSTMQRNKQKSKREVLVYCSESRNCSNNALRKLFFRDSLHLRGNIAWLALRMASSIRFFNSFATIANGNLAIDREGLISSNFPELTFSSQELKSGNSFLDRLKVDPQKFVCLHMRDSAYLTQMFGQQVHKHDYRDSEITTYVEAAEVLAEMGYTVFRMGALVKEPLVSKHPRVIDYAANGMRTEFLDIFLGAHCTFCVSTGTGWDSVPTIFRRPILFVNLLPIFSPSANTLPITIYPKLLGSQGSPTSLSLIELIQRNLASSSNTTVYADAGVEIRDLSSEELVEAVTEMAQRVEGTFVETPEQKEMQAKLKHILSTHPKLQPTPNYYPIRAEFASCFFSRYSNFMSHTGI